MSREDIVSNFRNPRYELLNQCRWTHFLAMGLPLAGQTIFEPGAGIGDQTEWLLSQDVKHIHVNDGRPDNLDIVRERFGSDPRLTFVEGNLEKCLGDPGFDFKVDFIFCYGVYYHLSDACPDFPILRGLANKGQTIALDYLTGPDRHTDYGYDNPSTSISQHAFRPRTETLLTAMKEIWGYAYTPAQPLNWKDPVVTEDRLVAVASRSPLDNPNLSPWTVEKACQP